MRESDLWLGLSLFILMLAVPTYYFTKGNEEPPVTQTLSEAEIAAIKQKATRPRPSPVTNVPSPKSNNTKSVEGVNSLVEAIQSPPTLTASGSSSETQPAENEAVKAVLEAHICTLSIMVAQGKISRTRAYSELMSMVRKHYFEITGKTEPDPIRVAQISNDIVENAKATNCSALTGR